MLIESKEKPSLDQIEREAFERNLILRIKVGRPLNLWALRLVVAEQIEPDKVKILGEMKAWAYPEKRGFQLDTMKVLPKASLKVGPLIWAATMAWARESTPCTEARLLAIKDDPYKHAKLTRYFRWQGFKTIKDVGAGPSDLPLRLIWGGAGTLMIGNCDVVFKKNYLRWASRETQEINQQSSA